MAYKQSKTTPAVWEERYNTASGTQTKMFKRFANWYDSLYAQVGITPSPWRSKIYVPVLARQTWALLSKFLALKPNFEVRVVAPQNGGTPPTPQQPVGPPPPVQPGQPQQPAPLEHPESEDPMDIGDDDVSDKAEKAARKLEYDYENPYLDESMRDKLFAPLLDAVVTGTGLAKVCWNTEKRERYERMPDSEGNVDLTKEKKFTKTVGYNDLEPVNIFNVFVSPSATNLYSAPWIIIKEFKPISELQAINDAKGIAIYKNLDQLTGNTSYDDDFSAFNFSRNRLMNQQDRVDKTVKMVKIYECYEGNTICTYAESGSNDSNGADNSSWILLREQTNPYWHGKYPLVRFQVKNKPFQFWGEGIYETTYRLQTAYNDSFNHYMDQWNLAENSMLMMPENANVNDYIIEPGGQITYRGNQPPTQFKHSEPNPNQLQTILTYMDQAIEGVTISQYASGLPNSATDKTKGTAAGILHLQEAAGDLVSFMRTNFTQSITQIGRMWLSNNQQYMQDPVNISTTIKGRIKPMTVTPADMQGELELMIDEDSMDPGNKDQRIARFMAYVQQLEQMQSQSFQQAQNTRWATEPIYLDYAALMQDYSEIMDHPQYASLLLGDTIVQEAMKNAQTPWFMPHERFQIDINELYGSEAAQYLERNGVTPDPAREQQTPVQGNAYMASRNGPGGAPEPNPDATTITPDHVLQADQQSHQQLMDVHNLQLKAEQQAAAQQQAAQQAQLQQQQAAQQQQQTQQPNVDKSTFAMAQELANQGHIDPSILAHLPQPEAASSTKPSIAKRVSKRLKGKQSG